MGPTVSLPCPPLSQNFLHRDVSTIDLKTFCIYLTIATNLHNHYIEDVTDRLGRLKGFIHRYHLGKSRRFNYLK